MAFEGGWGVKVGAIEHSSRERELWGFFWSVGIFKAGGKRMMGGREENRDGNRDVFPKMSLELGYGILFGLEDLSARLREEASFHAFYIRSGYLTRMVW